MENTVVDLQEWKSVGEAARLSGYSPNNIRKLANTGEIRVVRCGLGRLIHIDEIERLKQRHAERVRRSDDGGEAA